MKNLYYLFILSFLLISCGEDETNSTSPITPSLKYTLTIQINPTEGGSVFPSSGEYNDGDQVSVQATPNQYYEFKSWGGNGNGSNSNPLVVTINSNMTLIAEFNFIDADADGITDESDNCPNTPSGSIVNENGCPDTDADGISDQIDICPDTPENTSVNEEGCPYIYLAENGVTLIANDFAELNKTYSFNSIEYLIVDYNGLKSSFDANKDLSKVITTFVQVDSENTIHKIFLSPNRPYQEFNDDISSWDVRGITNMGDMFSTHLKFNQNIGYWDVSNVTDMHYMFWNANEFNQDISNWDVSSVDGSQGTFERGMEGMFYKAVSFNQDLSKWDVSKVPSCIQFRSGATNYVLPIPLFTLCNPD